MVHWTIITSAIGIIAVISGCVLGSILFPAMVNKKVAEVCENLVFEKIAQNWLKQF